MSELDRVQAKLDYCIQCKTNTQAHINELQERNDFLNETIDFCSSNIDAIEKGLASGAIAKDRTNEFEEEIQSERHWVVKDSKKIKEKQKTIEIMQYYVEMEDDNIKYWTEELERQQTKADVITGIKTWINGKQNKQGTNDK